LVLILTNMVGGLVGTALTFIGWLRQKTKLAGAKSAASNNDVSMWRVAKQHRDFPLLRTPQNLINGVSQSLPVLLLASFFGSAAAGQYTIALSVLAVPATLVGGSVMSVFYPRINDALHKGENAQFLIIRATLGMALTGGLPYLVVVAAGPILFPFIFGEKWNTAGHYAQWLAPWLFLQFINKPAVAAIPALRLQGGLLIYELFSTGTKVIALWLGFSVFEDDVTAVALFSIAGIVAYAWLILWVIRRSAPSVAQVS
jgi:O-antigen/teichoic acid export membrane protein